MFKLIIIILILTIQGCQHPESSNFSRDSANQIKQEKGLSDSGGDEKETVLRMEVEDGVRYVWIEVNGIKLRFVFDTGASNISLSPIEASLLYKQGTLLKEDIISTQYFQDATGKISEGTKINLRLIKVGNRELQNVEAIVIDNIDAPLLMGQSVLERFGSIKIDNNKNEIVLN